MTPPRVLVAGIGNLFLGDDGFGVVVARKLSRRPLPPGVVVMDAGIRGIDLTYALMDGYAAAILVDAAPRGRSPGTLTVLDVDPDGSPRKAGPDMALLDAHGMDPASVLAFVRASGASLGPVRVVCCEPLVWGTASDDPLMELSAPVEAAVAPAIDLIQALLGEFLRLPIETPTLLPRECPPCMSWASPCRWSRR